MITLAGKVHQVWELEPVYPSAPEGDAVRLRVEILQLRKRVFKARLWRLEHYRIQPTFPQQNRKPQVEHADEVIPVLDEGIIVDIDKLTAPTPKALLQIIVSRIAEQFNLRQASK